MAKTIKNKSKAEKAVKKPALKNDLSVSVYNVDGQEEKTVNLPKAIFGVKVNPQLLAQYVKAYLINQRHGTASTKLRGEVIGSTRKIYRQKGTGKARHGDLKAPIFVGGGVVGGPKPKYYHADINKKVKKIALAMALSNKEKEKEIFVLSDKFKDVGIKTKKIALFLKKLNCFGKKILFILPALKKNNLILSSQNILKLEIGSIASINPYQLLNSDKVFFLEESLKVLSDRFIKE